MIRVTASTAQISRSTQRPLLLYLTRQPCHDCKNFELIYLIDPDIIKQMDHLVKMKLITNQKEEMGYLLRRYEIKTFPSMLVHTTPKSPPMKLHLLYGLGQIWLPKSTYKRGAYTLLSKTTFQLALEETIKQARTLATPISSPSVQ